jgi:hypothetical protein
MTMTTSAAHARLARELTDAEVALDEALIRQSQLFTSMIVARRDVEVDQFTGQDVLMRLNKAQQELLSSGGGLARVHGRLIEIGREVGGLSQDCPVGGQLLADDSLAA